MASSSDRWRQIEALFYEALEFKGEARSEFLDKKCEHDAELRKEVETLLASSDESLDFLQQPVLKAAHRVIADDRL